MGYIGVINPLILTFVILTSWDIQGLIYKSWIKEKTQVLESFRKYAQFGCFFACLFYFANFDPNNLYIEKNGEHMKKVGHLCSDKSERVICLYLPHQNKNIFDSQNHLRFWVCGLPRISMETWRY